MQSSWNILEHWNGSSAHQEIQPNHMLRAVVASDEGWSADKIDGIRSIFTENRSGATSTWLF
jgi:hypothetical protein